MAKPLAIPVAATKGVNDVKGVGVAEEGADMLEPSVVACTVLAKGGEGVDDVVGAMVALEAVGRRCVANEDEATVGTTLGAESEKSPGDKAPMCRYHSSVKDSIKKVNNRRISAGSST